VILVHLGKRADVPMMIMLCVSNVGAGAARNIMLEFDDQIVEEHIKSGKLFDGFRNTSTKIKVIPQDKRVEFPMNVGHVLVAEPKLPELFVKVRYEDIDGYEYESFQAIDIAELAGQDFSKSPIAKIAEEVEKTTKALEKLASNQHRFRTITQTVEEHRREEQEWRNQMVREPALQATENGAR
jgi:TRAP-type mannitol/chloroaromatic compound transport system substrate-binding protein